MQIWLYLLTSEKNAFSLHLYCSSHVQLSIYLDTSSAMTVVLLQHTNCICSREENSPLFLFPLKLESVQIIVAVYIWNNTNGGATVVGKL